LRAALHFASLWTALSLFIWTICRQLWSAELYAKIKECGFYTDNTEYLGFKTSSCSLEMDPKKASTILAWSLEKIPAAVCSFLGSANFDYCFILNYSTIALPEFILIKNCAPFIWASEC
jgi:hypothetical protein